MRERVKRYGDIDGVDAIQIGFIDSMTPEEKETTIRPISDLISIGTETVQNEYLESANGASITGQHRLEPDAATVAVILVDDQNRDSRRTRSEYDHGGR